MPFFCSCRVCKINSKDGGGKWLSTKKTFKKHQEKEKTRIEKMSESETESDKNESDKSDTSSENSNDESASLILEDINKR